mgnify:CR=1 FL=1
MKNKQSSEYLSEFLRFIESVNKEYSSSYQAVGVADKVTQDYLHQLELGEYSSRQRTATALANNLKERRENKDVIAILKPIYDFISTKPQVINELKKILGEVRKQEGNKARYYYPRVVEDLEISRQQTSR